MISVAVPLFPPLPPSRWFSFSRSHTVLGSIFTSFSRSLEALLFTEWLLAYQVEIFTEPSDRNGIRTASIVSKDAFSIELRKLSWRFSQWMSKINTLRHIQIEKERERYREHIVYNVDDVVHFGDSSLFQFIIIFNGRRVHTLCIQRSLKRTMNAIQGAKELRIEKRMKWKNETRGKTFLSWFVTTATTLPMFYEPKKLLIVLTGKSVS